MSDRQSRPTVYASDDEREEVIAALQVSFHQGRIDQTSYEQRVAQAMDAADFDSLVASVNGLPIVVQEPTPVVVRQSDDADDTDQEVVQSQGGAWLIGSFSIIIVILAVGFTFLAHQGRQEHITQTNLGEVFAKYRQLPNTPNTAAAVQQLRLRNIDATMFDTPAKLEEDVPYVMAADNQQIRVVEKSASGETYELVGTKNGSYRISKKS